MWPCSAPLSHKEFTSSQSTGIWIIWILCADSGMPPRRAGGSAGATPPQKRNRQSAPGPTGEPQIFLGCRVLFVDSTMGVAINRVEQLGGEVLLLDGGGGGTEAQRRRRLLPSHVVAPASMAPGGVADMVDRLARLWNSTG